MTRRTEREWKKVELATDGEKLYIYRRQVIHGAVNVKCTATEEKKRKEGEKEEKRKKHLGCKPTHKKKKKRLLWSEGHKLCTKEFRPVFFFFLPEFGFVSCVVLVNLKKKRYTGEKGKKKKNSQVLREGRRCTPTQQKEQDEIISSRDC